jgi:tetratricopeptide (TPR) repeat protein
MEEYSEALKFYQKMFSIQQYYLPQNPIDTAAIENNIGQMYERIGEHWKASEHYENALKCCQMALEASLESDPKNVTDLAIIYNTMAPICKNMKDYSKAYQFYRMIIEILLKYPHVKKPDLAATYDNIGQIYQNMHQNKNAYIFYREARRIAEQSSPPNPSQLRLYSAHCAGISTIDFTMCFGLTEWKFTENMSLIPI